MQLASFHLAQMQDDTERQVTLPSDENFEIVNNFTIRESIQLQAVHFGPPWVDGTAAAAVADRIVSQLGGAGLET